MIAKPKNKKERNAAKAIARSKRNSPGGKLAKAQVRSELSKRTKIRKRRQAIARTTFEMRCTAKALDRVNENATDAATAIKLLRDCVRDGLDLDQLTVADLRSMCSDCGIQSTTKMRKSELIDLLMAKS